MSPVAPEISVVVPSHERPLRLRWLLNALEEQTLARSRWEVVVCHDSSGSDTDEVLERHPLARDGVLVSRRCPPSSAAAKRNAGVALARGRTIVFTDDDCRPPADWLERVADAVSRHPGAIVQGAVAPDPDEDAMRRGPYPRTQAIDAPPTPWAECANIAYPRALVVQVGGFAEEMAAGEDTDLALRVRAAGAPYIGDRAMLTYHAIEDATVLDWIRATRRWRDVPLLIRRHPQLRRELALGVFWQRTHALLPLAVYGLRRTARHPLWAALAIPWALQHHNHPGGVRGRIRQLAELPGWAIVDLAELSTVARGAIQHRSPVL